MLPEITYPDSFSGLKTEEAVVTPCPLIIITIFCSGVIFVNYRNSGKAGKRRQPTPGTGRKMINLTHIIQFLPERTDCLS